MDHANPDVVSGMESLTINPVDASPSDVEPSPSDVEPSPSRNFEVHAVIKSVHDQREYKYLILKNKLKVLLISDPTTEKAAAALDVHVGNMCDPDDIPGIAHFCEHMLFMGTKKYPVENDFTQFLSEHGGQSNAFTGSEHTNYHFEVRAEALAGALDRFAQFFLCPLFDANSKDREVQAIDSEHQKNINNDGRRLNRIDRLTSKKGHVYCKFGTGNLNTLETIPKERNVDIREVLLNFHQEWYSSNIMATAVLGKESLAELEDMVVPLFSEAVNKDVVIPSYTEHPHGKDELKLSANVVSVKDMRSLKVKFPLPDLDNYYQEKPAHYVMHMIGHEGEGSLLSLLKKKGWVNVLYAGPHGGAKGFAFFSVSMELSEDGMDHIDDIVEIFFQYVHLLKCSDPEEWIFNEMKVLEDMKFLFKDKSQPVSDVTNLVSSMHAYNPSDVLCGGYVLRTYRPDLIKMVLEYIIPDNVRISLSSQSFEGKTDQEDDYYGAKYSINKIPDETIQKWSNVSAHEDLHLPSPNPFIPDNLEMVVPKCESEEKALPTLLKDTDLMRIWYKADDTFFLPKACLSISIASPFASTSPLHLNQLTILVALVKDSLAEYAYDAELAGIDYGVQSIPTGIQVSINGYNNKQSVLLKQILHKIVSLEMKEDRFNIFKEELRQAIMNIEAEQPYVATQELEAYVLEEIVWRPEELLEALTDVTLESLAPYKKLLLGHIYIEALLIGNMTVADAETVITLLEEAFVVENVSQAMPLLHHKLPREYILPDGCSYLFEKRNKIHQMSCVMVYLQFGLQGTHENVLAEMVSQCMKEACFDTLRTKEQLGYIVFSGLGRSRSCQGLKLLIQSDKEPREVESRMDHFLTEFEALVTDMDAQTFLNHVEALVLRKLERAKRLKQEAYKYLHEINSKQYHFNRPKVEVEELRTLTKQDVLDFYKKMVAPSSSIRRKLAVVSLGKEAASVTEPVKPECTEASVTEPVKPECSDENAQTDASNEWSVVSDILKFKTRLPLHPRVTPYMDIPIAQTTKSKL